jgi:hypothetical protein
MADPIPCPNPAHGWRRSVARVSFPDAQFAETTACRSCAIWQLRTALDLGHSVLVEPIKAEDGDG